MSCVRAGCIIPFESLTVEAYRLIVCAQRLQTASSSISYFPFPISHFLKRTHYRLFSLDQRHQQRTTFLAGHELGAAHPEGVDLLAQNA